MNEVAAITRRLNRGSLGRNSTIVEVLSPAIKAAFESEHGIKQAIGRRLIEGLLSASTIVEALPAKVCCLPQQLLRQTRLSKRHDK